MYIKWKRSSFWQSYELLRRKKTKAITVFVWDSLKVARKGSSAVCEKGSRKDSGCGKDGGKNVERIVQCVKMIVWKRHGKESAVCGKDSGKNVERILQCVKRIVWKRYGTESAVCDTWPGSVGGVFH